MQPLSPLCGCLAVAHQHLALQHAEFTRWLEGLLSCILSLLKATADTTGELNALNACTVCLILQCVARSVLHLVSDHAHFGHISSSQPLAWFLAGFGNQDVRSTTRGRTWP